jgi:ribosomal protein L11 methylase PrmA
MPTKSPELKPRRDAGSFRDPSGHVFHDGERVLRTVHASAVKHVKPILRSKVLNKLADKGLLIRTELIELSAAKLKKLTGARGEAPSMVLAHPRIPFISYPYEWVFSQLQDAALAHLRLQLAALEVGFTLSDATAYNMQFSNGRPLHIDVLSLRPYAEGEAWAGYNQFCRQFLLPLLIEAWAGIGFQKLYRGGMDGVTFEDALSLLPKRRMLTSVNGFLHVYLHGRSVLAASSSSKVAPSRRVTLRRRSYQAMLEGLEGFISGLKSGRRAPGYWQDYAAVNSYSDHMRETKLAFIRQWASKARPGMVWDIGGNTGEYAEAAAQAAKGQAVVLDSDMDCLEACYRERTRKHGQVLPVRMDLGDPSPGLGWRESERKGLSGRDRPNGIMALAVIHHMCIRGNLPLADAVDWMIGTAPSGVIEFVPKRDPMVAELLQAREDIFPDYTEENFRKAVKARAKITAEHLFEQNGRLLISYTRDNARHC